MDLVLVFLGLVVGILVYIFAFGPKLPPDTNAIVADVLRSELAEVVSGETDVVISDGLPIWYECIPPQMTPKGTVLLIISNGGNVLDWPPKFVRAFVDAGYRVIRYDHRGTGLSDRVENWDRRHPYSVADMTNDAVAVLDRLRVDKTHVLGLSMGGMIAQEVAASHPDKIISLTLLSTSGYVGDLDLPGLTSGYLLSSLM
jgi:pimeloyl-ACP methyl ester carboxylesterase